jgi:hypothetical protein
VRDVLYLGADTRYLVDLDLGITMIVTRPNLGDADGVAAGSPVQLSWRESHVYELARSTTSANQTGGDTT